MFTYEEVIRKLVNGLRFARVWSREWDVPTTSALSQARKRLGEEPMKMLFERVAVPVAKPGTPGAWIRHWRIMALDGVMIDVPDTPGEPAVLRQTRRRHQATIPADPHGRTRRGRHPRRHRRATGHHLPRRTRTGQAADQLVHPGNAQKQLNRPAPFESPIVRSDQSVRAPRPA